MKMKNFLLKILLLSFIMLSCMILFAQDSTGTGTGTNPPLDPFAAIFLSVTILATFVMPITGWVKTHILKNVNTQNLSWVVAEALAFLGFALKLGIFATTGIFWTVAYGLIAGWTANGLSNTAVLDGLLTAIGAKIKAKK